MRRQQEWLAQRAAIEQALMFAAATYASPISRQRIVGGRVIALLADGTIRDGHRLLAPGGQRYDDLRRALGA